MAPAEALRNLLVNTPGSLWAVVDGAKFSNVRQTLDRLGLRSIPLFLELPRKPAPVAGPFLVPLSAPDLHQFLTIPHVEKACVFWSAPAEEAVVFRHLRGLNYARIPLQTRDAVGWEADGKERALLRHWDPSVMALLVPLLDEEQRHRLFGPLSRLTLYAADHELPVQARADPNERRSRGPLVFTPSQMRQIAQAMRERSHRSIARYLRDTAPQQTASMGDAALIALVADAEAEGRSWGLRSEAGLGRFAWLWLTTNGRLGQLAPIRAFLEGPGASPDEKLKRLMSASASHAAALEPGVS